MLIIDQDIFGKNEEIKLFGDERDNELLTKIILLEDQVVSNYLFDTVINFQTSLMMEDFLIEQLESKRQELRDAAKMLEMLKGRKAQLQEQKKAKNKIIRGITEACGVVKKTLNVFKECTMMALNVAHALVTFDGDAFINSLVSGVKGIGGAMMKALFSQLKFVWNRITDLGSHIARTLADNGLECVGEGMLALGRFVVKMINYVCSDMGQKIIGVAAPVVMGIVGGVSTGGAGAAAGVQAGAVLAGEIALGCMAAQLGGLALTLQMSTFEQELKKMDEAEVDAQTARVKKVIKEIEHQAKMTAIEIKNERKRQECYEQKTGLVLGCLSFFECLFHEYPGLTPETALRVYFNSTGKKAFDLIIKSKVVPYHEIKDLLGVVVQAADDKFSGEIRCERFEPGFARFLSEVHGVSETNYCAYIGRTQIEALKKEYESIFEFNTEGETMTLREFLNKYGDAINQKAKEIATGKAFLYKDLLDIKNASDLNQMLLYKDIDYKKLFPSDMSLYSADEISELRSKKRKNIFLWTLLISGSMLTAWKIYDNVKRIRERS